MAIKEYVSISNVHKKVIRQFLCDEILLEEKVDGSQFSFGKIDDNLHIKSKNKLLNIMKPDKMFGKGVEEVLKIEDSLPNNTIFICEYLQKEKHNVLKYSRVPKRNLIVLDVFCFDSGYSNREKKEELAASIGLEVVPVLFEGKPEDIENIDSFLKTESVLGGTYMEGLVIKPKDYNGFNWKHHSYGKIVSDKFKEVHRNKFKRKENKMDITDILSQELTTDARFDKSFIHLKEENELLFRMEDIRKIMIETGKDIKKEEADYIKEKLFKWAWPIINKKVTQSIPKWYLKKLNEEEEIDSYE